MVRMVDIEIKLLQFGAIITVSASQMLLIESPFASLLLLGSLAFLCVLVLVVGGPDE